MACPTTKSSTDEASLEACATSKLRSSIDELKRVQTVNIFESTLIIESNLFLAAAVFVLLKLMTRQPFLRFRCLFATTNAPTRNSDAAAGGACCILCSEPRGQQSSLERIANQYLHSIEFRSRMIVLFIDAFGESADSNARFVQLKGIVNSVLQVAGSARQGVQLDIRKFDQLTEYLHNDASTKLDRSVLTSFDRIDCIICDGDVSSIRPWHARAQQLYRLLKQGIICDKPCLCAGWTASVLYAVMNSKGEPLKFLPNFPEGGVPDDIQSLKAPPKDEVFYEYRSGNIYEYNARKQQWLKSFCLGVCRRKRGDLVVGRTYVYP